MSCPYFDPVAPQVLHSGSESAMLPLGDAWAGVCRAVPDAPWQPGEAVLRPLCNLGYARGICARFPADDGPDAVRFTISRDDGVSVKLYYVLERNHHPFGHGPLEPAGSEMQASSTTSLLDRQAKAYVQSYLRRKREASRL